MSVNAAISSTVYNVVREGIEQSFGLERVTAKSSGDWRAVRADGTTLWLDTGDMDEAALDARIQRGFAIAAWRLHTDRERRACRKVVLAMNSGQARDRTAG